MIGGKEKIISGGGAKVGHRYYCVMCLAVYAKKAGISYEELEKDAFELQPMLDTLTTSNDNKFTREDVIAALEMYNDKYYTFPVDTIASITDIPIEKNKRNYRKQEAHLARARAVQNIDYPNGEWRNKNGRPTKEKEIGEWRKNNPRGTKTQCKKDTGIDPKTIAKYWDEYKALKEG